MRLLQNNTEYLSVKESAAHCGISLSTFYTYIYRGYIHTVPNQTKQLIKRTELMEFQKRIK